ncbi:hypothetical protein [Hyphomicrobium sp.]|uniref:hypothetical protein n=1 Tax=Hyphomicrobium sp. TaxID=82 RepID=UPI001DB274AA|nr:hypothetical protein [Hyphomicrobium sp.]MBY0559396.1 hypothetical protein [Hyphomicrobium sp.]
MAALLAKTACAVAVGLAAVLTANPSLADPAGSSTAPAGQRFEYGPYGSPNNSPGGGQALPQNNAIDPAGNDGGGAAERPSTDDQSQAPAYRDDYRGDNRDDGRGNAQPGADDNDDVDGPPVDAAGPPPGDYDRGLPRVEVRASAPDSNVPYEIREHDARSAAIKAWRSKVAGRFGPEFAHWRTAADKHVDCRPDAREGLVCIASGLPVRGFDRYGRWHREGQ